MPLLVLLPISASQTYSTVTPDIGPDHDLPARARMADVSIAATFKPFGPLAFGAPQAEPIRGQGSMQFLFNSDNQTPLGSGAAEEVQATVEARLDRISERLTRVEVHVSDVDGPRNGGDDKRCSIEIRPNGMRPIMAADKASTVEGAVSAAADKVLKAFDRQVGKTTTRKGH